jgi:hypothetical protein
VDTSADPALGAERDEALELLSSRLWKRIRTNDPQRRAPQRPPIKLDVSQINLDFRVPPEQPEGKAA